jgi:coenzyme F420 hydrogenase subunit beta
MMLRKRDKSENQSITLKEYMLPTLCYGCGTCSGICPNDAVVMRLDRKKGIYLPKIDKMKCNGCGICTQVCPWQFLDKGELDIFVYGKQSNDILGNYLGCYLGYSTNVKLTSASSGGLVSALLSFALEERIIDGALVTKMSETEPLNPEPFIAKTENQIISAAGSKYIPVPANVALKEILRKKGKYAVVGLPCHIQGIRKAEKINEKLNERIVLHLGLICSGTISSYGTNLLLKSLNINYKNFSQIYYRSDGWPGGFRAILKNGTQTPIIPHSDYFSIIRFYLPLPCLVCWDSTNELSDISFGDAWLDPIRTSDNKGTSLIVSRTEKGEELLKAAESKGIIKIDKIPSQEVIKAQKEHINFKKRNLAMRLSLVRVITNEAPNFRNIHQLDAFNYISKIRTSLLFVRCLLMSKRLTRNFITLILMRLLKSRMKKCEHFANRGN